MRSVGRPRNMKEPRKKKFDIVETLYNENIEYERLKCYLRKYISDNGCKQSPVSKIAVMQFDIPFESLANTICGYLEQLKTLTNAPNKDI